MPIYDGIGRESSRNYFSLSANAVRAEYNVDGELGGMDVITVFVKPKPIIATIAVDTGSGDATAVTCDTDSGVVITKTYDGNSFATGLKIELDGVESFDEMFAAAASYTCESENK